MNYAGPGKLEHRVTLFYMPFHQIKNHKIKKQGKRAPCALGEATTVLSW